MTAVLIDVVRQLRDLPSLSSVVVELLSTMEEADLDIQVLGAKIAMDQSLTAKTLRLANSSFYGMSTKVTTIEQAIAILGFHSIRTLVTACAVTGSFAPGADAQFDFKGFWRHSVATAVGAKLLAGHARLNPEAAFTAGLLHDIGKLVLATRFPDDYARVLDYRREHDCYINDAELAVFGIDHAAVGSALAAHWKFPESMQLAVASHHGGALAGPASLALLVHAANTIAHALDLTGDPDDLAPPMSDAVWDALALPDAAWNALFHEIEATYAEMCQILVN